MVNIQENDRGITTLSNTYLSPLSKEIKELADNEQGFNSAELSDCLDYYNPYKIGFFNLPKYPEPHLERQKKKGK